MKDISVSPSRKWGESYNLIVVLFGSKIKSENFENVENVENMILAPRDPSLDSDENGSPIRAEIPGEEINMHPDNQVQSVSLMNPLHS